MKKLLLILSLLLVPVSILQANNDKSILINDEVFSIQVKPSITSEFIRIETNIAKESILVKIIDKAGFIRIEKKLHLDREIDVSWLRKGYYLVKVYSENNMAIKRFYKGQDAINNK